MRKLNLLEVCLDAEKWKRIFEALKIYLPKILTEQSRIIDWQSVRLLRQPRPDPACLLRASKWVLSHKRFALCRPNLRLVKQGSVLPQLFEQHFSVGVFWWARSLKLKPEFESEWCVAHCIPKRALVIMREKKLTLYGRCKALKKFQRRQKQEIRLCKSTSFVVLCCPFLSLARISIRSGNTVARSHHSQGHLRRLRLEACYYRRYLSTQLFST